MRILVTGGAGYIGSHMVYTLVDHGYEVVVFDNLSMGHREAVHPEAIFVQGDLLNKPSLSELFLKYSFDGVFHFASHTMVGESTTLPWLYLRDNIVASANLLEQVALHKISRFILSSTSNLFSDPTTIPICEAERVVPGSPYGESKAIIERQLYWMEQLYNIAAVR